MVGNAFDIPILICFHLILLFFLTFSKPKFNTFDKIGIFWVTLIGLAIIRRIIHLNADLAIFSYFIGFVYYPVGYGPCLYLYAKYLTNPSDFDRKDLWHFLPLLICLSLPMLPGHQVSVSLDSNTRSSMVVYFFVIFTSISLLAYSYLTKELLTIHNKRLLESFSYKSIRITVSWLTGFIFLYLVVVLIQFSFFVIVRFGPRIHFPQALTSLLFIGYFYLVSYFLLRQDSIFRQVEPKHVDKKEKYAKSGLTPERLEEIRSKLLQFMAESKIYLQNDLNIEDVASGLSIASPHISQVLNQVLGKNFFQFVNEYRVKEVLRRLNHPSYESHSILRIALDSGFNSKSSFNSIFRKITGKTPNEFRD
jgi:AraC-like DNA-binding protein